MSTLNTFAEWRSEYPAWGDLKEWLVKTQPNLDIVESEGNYVILKTRKDDETQVCRSVVWNTRTNLPCSVAPFGARRDQAISSDKEVFLEDFVEGVMINVFRAADDPETHVTTRSRLDADGTFYSDRTFSELFEEALDTKKISLSTIERVMGEPYLALREDIGRVTSVFMSLVLSHPEHRVVRSVDKANFWAIYRGVVYDDGTVEFYTDNIPVQWRPKTYEFTGKVTWANVKAQFEEIKKTKPWYWQGLVAYQGLTERWRFRNGDHDRVRRELRGMESNPFGRFLRLRANKRVQEYLRIYPEDSQEFQGFEQDYRAATRNLYGWYCKCHKEHSVAFKDLPKSVQPLVFSMHKEYLEMLRPVGKSLHLAEVIEWLLGYLKTDYGIPNMIRFSKDE